MTLNTEDGRIHSPGSLPISYRMMWPKNAKKELPAVVFAPGFGSSLETSAYIDQTLKHIAQSGAVAISFNYSHTPVKDGKVDTGKLTCRNAEDDVRRVVHFAQNSPLVQNNKIIGMGCSFGANTLLRLQDPAFASYIMMALVPDLLKPFRAYMTPSKRVLWKMSQYMLGRGAKQVIEGDVQEINYQLYEQAEKLDMHRLVGAINKPVTFIQGTHDPLGTMDDIIRMGNAMHASPNVQMHFIQGAGHAFDVKRKEGQEHSELRQVMALTRETLTSFLVNEDDVAPKKRIGLWSILQGLNIKSFMPGHASLLPLNATGGSLHTGPQIA